MKSIPREGPSSAFDAVWPDGQPQKIVPEDSIRYLDPDSSLIGKIKIARGVGMGLLKEAKGAIASGVVSALALGVCAVIDNFDADKSDK